MVDWTQIIVTAITICVPAFVTLFSGMKTRKQANKHNTRSNIMQLIIEDHVRYMENKLPENKQKIHEEYDEYIACGGNSYIHDKVKEYDDWYKSITNKAKRRQNVNKKEKI